MEEDENKETRETLGMKKEKERKARAEAEMIEKQMKADLEGARKYGGA